jgi:hypothetical protein
MPQRGQRLRVYDCCSMRGWPRYGTAKPTKRWFCVEPARKEDCGDAVCKHTRHVEVAYVDSCEGDIYSTILTITVSTRTFATRVRRFSANLPDFARLVLKIGKVSTVQDCTFTDHLYGIPREGTGTCVCFQEVNLAKISRVWMRGGPRHGPATRRV